MADTVSRAVRSRIMAAVPQKNSKPELVVRSALHRLGYRFRLHRKDLPGSPDIVLPRYEVAIFVHGCFWHQHSRCRLARRPTSNRRYWNRKLDENIDRDKRKVSELRVLGWRALVIWQCQIEKRPDYVRQKLQDFLARLI